MVETFLTLLVGTIGKMGYFGIFVLMCIESTFIPLPSELVIPPAGYLISQGKMSWVGVIGAGALGNLAGAYINYALACYLGRSFILKYGKYVGLSREHFEKGERFFNTHGVISTFLGRFILGVRHYISFPAGLVKMDLKKFSFYTTLGAGMWIALLTYIGYVVGNNKEQIMAMSRRYTVYIVIFCAVTTAIYVMWYKRRTHRNNHLKRLNQENILNVAEGGNMSD